MKKTILQLGFLLSFALVAKSQDNYPTPETESLPYYFDNGTQAITALEKITAPLRTKLKLGGLAGGNSTCVIAGKQSAVTMPSLDTAIFLMKLGGSLSLSLADPSHSLTLYKMDVVNEERQVIIADRKGLLGNNKGKGSEKIEYDLKREGAMYIFLPRKKLEPGEYGFLNKFNATSDSTVVFCFRVE